MSLAVNQAVLLGESVREEAVYLAKMLRLHGLTVFTANTVDEFLNALEQHGKDIDLVCINGKLASERGGLLLSRIKNIHADIKIVVVAGTSDERAHILRYGANEFIQKPVSPETIVNKIIALLQQRES